MTHGTVQLLPQPARAALATIDSSRCEILELISDKWSLKVMLQLRAEPRRFTQLKRAIRGISQRMLTVTVRRLERNGILTRTVYSVMPPHVSYQLTPLGTTLLVAAGPLLHWIDDHRVAIDAIRADFDSRAATEPVTHKEPTYRAGSA